MMEGLYILLTFWCVSIVDNAGCRANVAQVWFPTIEACEERAARVEPKLRSAIESYGNQMYDYKSKCLPAERITLDAAG